VQRGKADADYLRATYEARFSDRELRDKQVLWSVLCESEFQQYVPEEGTVLDLGAGYCEFVNAIHARRRVAVDLNPDTAAFAAEGVEVITTSSDHMAAVTDGAVDTVFTSNFFEHLPDTEALLRTLRECHRVLRPAGTIVVLMPNIRNLPGAYWDYLDHHLALTQHSLSEALSLSGFEVTRVEPRFLPYTVRGSRLPVSKLTVRAYLSFKPAWLVLGKQMLVVARRS
jgi:SAM-dependent methyltransferase